MAVGPPRRGVSAGVPAAASLTCAPRNGGRNARRDVHGRIGFVSTAAPIWHTLRGMSRTLGAVILAAALAVPLSAHHSFAMFDTAKPITLIGTVTAFEWTNPHAYIELDATNDKGSLTHWSIELGSTSILMRAGWKFNTLTKGDKVTAVVSPLRNGEPGSLLNRITLADGKVLLNGPGGATATAGAPAQK
jgi:hypothetical protein